ncbi:MAG TPA: glycosyltransferase family 2 protein, partial [Solirubrobacteraceae bacterium]|nr:glycosyltransferase family 2 protein [Solirubrobacteraceae bacterium]
EALRGVQAQTLAPEEIIVVDDCSERPLQESTEVSPDLPVRFVRHPSNLGPAGSVVDGIRRAHGELVTTLNHDDVWEPRFLERLAGALDANPDAAFAFCDHGIMLADGEHDERRSREQSRRFGRERLAGGLLRGDTLYRTALLDKAVAASSFTLVRREALELDLIEAGGDMWDYCLAVGACRAGDAAFFLDERLGWYRVSPTMLTTTWLEPRKQVEMARVQIAVLVVILRSPKFAALHPTVRRRLALAVRHALMAAVRTREPASIGIVSARILAGIADARRLSGPHAGSYGQPR